MASDAVLSPPDLEKLRTFLVAEQVSLTGQKAFCVLVEGSWNEIEPTRNIKNAGNDINALS